MYWKSELSFSHMQQHQHLTIVLYIWLPFIDVQAPSVALCMSILQHHTDSHVSGQLILTMCDDLSSFLQPLAPGVPNLEVDYGLIIRSVVDRSVVNTNNIHTAAMLR